MASTGSSLCLRVLLTLFVAVVLVQSNRGKTVNKETCAKQLQMKKNKIPRFPTVPKKGTEPTICLSSPTCCTRNIEQSLRVQARKTLSNIISTKSGALKNAMSGLNMDLKEFSRNLIKQGHKETLEIARSYGRVADPSAPLLGTLFKEMENYLLDDKADLERTVDRFFEDLFPVIYSNLPSVALSKVKITQSYLNCMTNKIDEIKPYGALPRQVHSVLYNTLFSMKAFLHGLEFGANLANSMGSLNNVSDLCLDNFLKMKYCPMCKGMSNIKPCHQMCLDVYKGCLSMQLKVHGQWVSYMDTMETLADSLKKGLNMEKVIFSVHRHISDAVTFVMANLDIIDGKATAVCGKSPHMASNRQINYGGAAPQQQPLNPNAGASPKNPNSETKLSIFSNGIMMGDGGDPLGGLPGSLSNKMDMIIRNMTVLKSHFSSMPNTVCSKDKNYAEVKKDGGCWNGHSNGKYTSPLGGIKTDVSVEDGKKIQNIYSMFVAANKPVNEAILLDKSGTRKDGDFYIDSSGSGDNEFSGNKIWGECDDDDEDCSSGFVSGKKPDNENEIKDPEDFEDTYIDNTEVIDSNPDGIDEIEDRIRENNNNDPNYHYTGPGSSATSRHISIMSLTISTALVLLHSHW